MIKMFVMQTCLYCEYVERQVVGAFNEAKRIGDVGVPCYVLEDGTVSLSSKDAGLEPMPDDNPGASCSIDGSGCILNTAHIIED